MDKRQKATQLIDTLDKVSPRYSKAQHEMLAAREVMDEAEREYKDARVMAIASASGKNADIREAQANEDAGVIARLDELTEARRAFNAAYRTWKSIEAEMDYIKAATALLREIAP